MRILGVARAEKIYFLCRVTNKNHNEVVNEKGDMKKNSEDVRFLLWIVAYL